MHLFFYQNVTGFLFFFTLISQSCGDLIDRYLSEVNSPGTVLSTITKTFPFVVLKIEPYGGNE